MIYRQLLTILFSLFTLGICQAAATPVPDLLTPAGSRLLLDSRDIPWEQLTPEQQTTFHQEETHLGLPHNTLPTLRTLLRDSQIATKHWFVLTLDFAQRYPMHLERIQNLPEIPTLRESVKNALTTLNFPEADSLLANAAITLKDDPANLAPILAFQADLANTRFQYTHAASLFQQARQLLPDKEHKHYTLWLNREQSAWNNQGLRHNDRNALEQAVTLHREWLTLNPREKNEEEWAENQEELGDTLETLGLLIKDAETLRLALTTHKEALPIRSKNRTSTDWAAHQVQLGELLKHFGILENDQGFETLQRAALAYKEALKIYTKERYPYSWARTQLQLADLYYYLGNRDSGTYFFDLGTQIYQQLLGEYNQERAPFLWAEIQNEFSQTQATLARRKHSLSTLRKAIATGREALKEWTLKRLPENWARAHYNLGLDLIKLGQDAEEAEPLLEAVTTYQTLLEIPQTIRGGITQVKIQHKLGRALLELGKLNHDKASLEKAVNVLETAMPQCEENNDLHEECVEFLQKAKTLLQSP
ncbi:MAG: hypothetical protein HQL56_01555 [Magnetococcales bacterium]|nr:hypothetical protein [Magnetococcales bacterium]